MIWRCAQTCFLLPLLLQPFVSAYQKTEANEGDPGLNTYVTRPDLRATKWNITVYHEDLLAPGYWFVGPYRILSGDEPGHGWVGAHIYDGKGELVWSGVHMFSRGNVEDFRVSNVNGEYLMTVMDQGRGHGIIVDNNYKIREQVKMQNFNSHEFNFVDNGTRALVIKNNPTYASREESEKIGFHGQCHAAYDWFQELDVTDNWKPVFTFDTQGQVALEESTLIEKSPERRCNKAWDFIHTNSIDKTDEGDYLLSGRHTDALYKISKENGNIIWRLGGVKSDFTMDDEVRFTRQHDVRFRGRNDTHMFISILDNAKGIDHAFPPSYPFSRGLLLAVNERDMTVSIVTQFDHPMTEDRYSPRRGNYQLLPNGNIFMGWSEQGVQSEHSPDGTLLMEAIFAVEWLGTYRQYKFPWVGAPTDPPDVYAEATKDDNSIAVYVSWNGATEVTTWNLYKTNEQGDTKVLLASVDKTGFETVIAHRSFESHVIVTGLAKNGTELGSSKVFKTVTHGKATTEKGKPMHDTVSDTVSDGTKGAVSKTVSILQNPIVAFFIGFICSAGLLSLIWFVRRNGVARLTRRTRYHRLRPTKEEENYEQFSEGSDGQASPLRRLRESSDDGA